MAANKYFPTSNPPSTKIGQRQAGAVAAAQCTAEQLATTPKALQSVSAALAASPRVASERPSLRGSINLKGAQIDDLLLLNQKQTIAKNSPPVRLLSPLGAPGAYIAAVRVDRGRCSGPHPRHDLDCGQPDPDARSAGYAQHADAGRDALPDQDRVDDGYLFTIQQSVTNGSGQPIIVRPIGLVSRASQSVDRSTWQNHVGPIGVFDGKANYSVNWKDLDQGSTPGVRRTLAAGSALLTNTG